MDTALGRFYASDLIGPVDSKTGKINDKILAEPQRLNAYAYALNDPLNSIDPFGLLTVHIWDYRGSDVAWGHASITLENGTHIIWWPQATGRQSNKLFPQIYSVVAYQYQTFQDDITYEGQNPDKNIRILGLDEAAIERWWNNYQPTNQWKTLSQNCSTTAAEALTAGGADVLWPDFLQAHHRIWTPADVEAYAGAINRYLATPHSSREGEEQE
jgi:RHS repeat-associated protein